jgi:uncharacterized membrane protein
MVDTESLVESRLAHVVALVLGAVGVAALVSGGVATSAFWFWLFYGIAWLSFLDLFDDETPFWERFSEGAGAESTERSDRVAERDEDEEPLARLKHRYAAGEIDDAEFDRRLDRLLETPDSVADLRRERERAAVETDRE